MPCELVILLLKQPIDINRRVAPNFTITLTTVVFCSDWSLIPSINIELVTSFRPPTNWHPHPGFLAFLLSTVSFDPSLTMIPAVLEETYTSQRYRMRSSTPIWVLIIPLRPGTRFSNMTVWINLNGMGFTAGCLNESVSWVVSLFHCHEFRTNMKLHPLGRMKFHESLQKIEVNSLRKGVGLRLRQKEINFCFLSRWVYDTGSVLSFELQNWFTLFNARSNDITIKPAQHGKRFWDKRNKYQFRIACVFSNVRGSRLDWTLWTLVDSTSLDVSNTS